MEFIICAPDDDKIHCMIHSQIVRRRTEEMRGHEDSHQDPHHQNLFQDTLLFFVTWRLALSSGVPLIIIAMPFLPDDASFPPPPPPAPGLHPFRSFLRQRMEGEIHIHHVGMFRSLNVCKSGSPFHPLHEMHEMMCVGLLRKGHDDDTCLLFAEAMNWMRARTEQERTKKIKWEEHHEENWDETSSSSTSSWCSSSPWRLAAVAIHFHPPFDGFGPRRPKRNLLLLMVMSHDGFWRYDLH